MKNIKAITKWLLGAAMAGAFILAAPHKADAQVVVQVGAYAPAPAYFGPARYDRWRRHERFEHRRWEDRRFHGRRFRRY